MFCAACGAGASSAVCQACRADLRRPVAGSVGECPAFAAFEHRGAARRLVHALKFDGSAHAAAFLGRHMGDLVPPSAGVLVPVPRSWTRRVRFGVDAALLLAEAISRRTGIAVAHVLRVPPWHRPRTARSRRGAGMPMMWSATRIAGHVVVIDDVRTSGATLAAALEALAVREATVVTATAAWR